ncbi:MAG: hypothetical protein IJ680_02285, partial [Paludibacteraceae bacterium]|nr:hypothetical protein [Paludibacteraceae bacterium]
QTLFVPVLTFAHTLQIDRAAHRFYETRVDTAFFPNTYLNQNATNDTAALRTIQNTLSVTLEEAASPLGFGLTAYLHNNTRQYLYLQDDSLIRHRWQSDLMLGAEATRQAGRYFHFLIDGQICLAGYRLGQYRLGAQLQGHIPLGRHTLDLTAYARSESRKPDLLEHTYLSNHFRRSDLDLRSTLTNHIGAQAAFAHPNISASLRVDMQNLTHAIYYTDGGLKQYDGNIQIVAADLSLRLNSRHFALDNHAVWQQTSSYVIALPQITLYENIYYYARWFNQLDVQFGVDMRYHTAYYAPLYMPGLGQFTVQQHTRVAPPPILSVYANLRIKTVRFYAAYTHFNQLLSDHYNYYSMPLYPLNPASLRLGISWNFFN